MQKSQKTLTDAFHNFAKTLSGIVGAPWAFIGSLLIVAAWAATGPLFHYSDTWQLIKIGRAHV